MGDVRKRTAAPFVYKGAGYTAKLRISNGDLLAGDAPSRVLRETRRWIAEHRDELLVLWDEFQR